MEGKMNPFAIGIGVVLLLLFMVVVTANSHQKERMRFAANRALFRHQTRKKDDDEVKEFLPTFVVNAAKTGNLRMLQRFTNSNGDLNMKSKDSQLTALHLAAKHGQSEIAKHLLSRKADPNSRALRHGECTSLHFAALGGHGALIKILLDFGADPNCSNLDGHTPYAVAERSGNFGCVRLLQRGMAKMEQTSNV